MDEKVQKEKTSQVNKTAKKSKAEEIEELTASLAEEQDKYLRLLAEFDNFRKRTRKEKEQIYNNCLCDSIGAILPLMDNIERATKTTGDSAAIIQGVEMVLKQFSEVLSNLKVEEIDTTIPFDPELHNAVMHTDDAEKGDGEITDVFQKGYKIGDKVIRHAMVSVAN